MTQRLPFLGLDFDPLDAEAAARAIVARAREAAPFGYVATPNVDHIVRLEGAPDLKQLYADAWLTLCDSRVLEMMAGASGLALPAAPGADVVEIMLRDHIDPDEPVSVIGGTLDTINTLRARYALSDLRWHAPPHNLARDAGARAACVDFIVANPSSYVFLAVGSPQQEMIAHETLARAGAVGVGVCCGASLDFLTGRARRAPAAMQAIRAEWLWRLGSEPSRLGKRYLVDGPRILGVWHRWKAAGARS